MDNIEIKRDGDRLYITIDLSKNFGPTKTGKSNKIANSSGWEPILDSQEGYRLNLLLVKVIK